MGLENYEIGKATLSQTLCNQPYLSKLVQDVDHVKFLLHPLSPEFKELLKLRTLPFATLITLAEGRL